MCVSPFSIMSQTVVQAQHIESFLSSGYKRTFSSISGNPVLDGDFSAAKQLAVPNGQIPALNGQIHSTSSKPDQGVNVTIPIARACDTHLTIGQVAFVFRNAGKVFYDPLNMTDTGTRSLPPNASAKTGGMERIISMEQLNELLALEQSHVEFGAAGETLFVSQRAKHMFTLEDRFSAKRVEVTPRAVFKRRSIIDPFHPLLQYTLDGIVHTPADGDEHDNDGYTKHSSDESKPCCNVAVHGPCALTVLHMPSVHDRGFDVSSPDPSRANAAPNVFMEPVRILSEIYVVLVAERETAASTKWKFSYNVVSQSNLDLDVPFPSNGKNFRTFLKPLYEGQTGAQMDDALRIIVDIKRLGKVVDCKFGPSNSPQVVVAVNIKQFEPVKPETNIPRPFPVDASRPDITATQFVPKQIWRAFEKIDRNTQRSTDSARRGTANALKGPLTRLREPFGKLKNLTSALADENDDDDLLTV